MKRIAVTVRRCLREQIEQLVRENGGIPVVTPWPRSPEEWRYFLHQHGPDGAVLDGEIGADRWDALTDLGHVQGVRHDRQGPPDLFVLLDAPTERLCQRVQIQGAAVIDLSDAAWSSALAVRVASVQMRPVVPRSKAARSRARRSDPSRLPGAAIRLVR